MLNNDLIKAICELYPNKAHDIGESISLMNIVLEELLNIINQDISKKLVIMNHEIATKLVELHKKVSDEFELNREICELIESSISVDLIDDLFVQTYEEEKRNIPNYGDYVVDQTVPHTLFEDFEHKKPIGFKLNDKIVEASNWANVLQLTCELLYNIDPKIFNSFIGDGNMNGKKRSYFSYSEDNIRKPKKLKCAQIYIEINLSANSIKQIIIKMLKKYKIRLTDYIVYFRADYTEIGKK